MHSGYVSPSTTEPFELLLYSSHLDEKWKRLVGSSPKRVVAIFDLQPDSRARTRWGDGIEDMTPALRAVDGIIRGGPSSTWNQLVRAGVVDRLCQCVAGICKAYDYPPNRPAHMKTPEFMETMHATYYQPLSMIASTLTHSSGLPEATHQVILGIVRKYWRSMITRLWTEPQMTLHAHDVHVHERVLIISLLKTVLQLDPMMASGFCQPLDLSIALGVRAWLHATYTADFGALSNLFDQFRRSMGPDCLTKQFSSILQATGGSSVAFYSKFASHLRIIQRDFESTAEAIRFLESVHGDAHGNAIFFKDGGGEPYMGDEMYFGDFVDACLWHYDLWTSVFESVIQEATLDGPGRWDVESSNVLSRTMTTLGSLLRYSLDHYPEKSARLVKLWARQGLFDALELGLIAYTSVPTSRMTCKLTYFFSTLNTITRRSTSLLSVLHIELPRARLMFRLLESAFGDRDDPSADVEILVDTLENSATPDNHWWFFEQLEKQVAFYGSCSTRKYGCRRKGSKCCKGCGAVLYCSRACQKVDWAAHKTICGFRVLDAQDSEGRQTKRIQFPHRWAPHER